MNTRIGKAFEALSLISATSTGFCILYFSANVYFFRDVMVQAALTYVILPSVIFISSYIAMLLSLLSKSRAALIPSILAACLAVLTIILASFANGTFYIPIISWLTQVFGDFFASTEAIFLELFIYTSIAAAVIAVVRVFSAQRGANLDSPAGAKSYFLYIGLLGIAFYGASLLFFITLAPRLTSPGSLSFLPPVSIVLALVFAVLGSTAVNVWLASLIAGIAKSKKRSWTAFFWLTLLVGPLLMWIIAVAISSTPDTSAPIAPSPKTSGSDSLDITKAIENLGSLKSQGLITSEEFEAKKSDLLKRI